MSQKKLVRESSLAALAKHFRKESSKTRAQAAREMDVSQTSVFQAEEMPEQALVKLRMRMIEAYSPYRIDGPIFRLRKK